MLCRIGKGTLWTCRVFPIFAMVLTMVGQEDGGLQQLGSDCTLVLHKHDELIGTSALVTAAASLACSAGSSSLSPRRVKHSTSPCSAHTLSGCRVQRCTL